MSPKLAASLLGLTIVLAVLAMRSALAPTAAAATASASPFDVCQRVAVGPAAGYGPIASIRRAETDTVGSIAQWQEEELLPDIIFRSPLRDVDQGLKWTVCVYSGRFSTPTAPDADGSPPPPHDTLRVLVTNTGELILDSAGYAGKMDPETPQDMWK